jgi:hypothetical protein
MKENTFMKVVAMSIVFLSIFGFFAAMTGDEICEIFSKGISLVPIACAMMACIGYQKT